MRGETRTDAIARLDQQRIEFPPDHGVAAGSALQLDLALDRLARGVAVGMEVGRAVVSFDDGDGAARPEQRLQRDQRLEAARDRCSRTKQTKT